jgi:hypothetical protein
MSESQNIEYKSSWRDEYLKWICSFANAQGGTLYIGKDDNGDVVGVKDSKKLMEDLPNKITTILGIKDLKNMGTIKKGILGTIVGASWKGISLCVHSRSTSKTPVRRDRSVSEANLHLR